MIKYKLICKTCNISFDSWFASSGEFERLKKRKFLSCHVCNSTKIEKTLMAPKLNTRSDTNKRISKYKKRTDIIIAYTGGLFTRISKEKFFFAKKTPSVKWNNMMTEATAEATPNPWVP